MANLPRRDFYSQVTGKARLAKDPHRSYNPDLLAPSFVLYF